MRTGSEPKRTSSGAWLRSRLYGWLCSCLPKHDRAEGRSHRRFRRDAMVLGGVIRRVVWHHSGAKRVARMKFFVRLSPVGRGRATQVACLRLAQFLCRTRASPSSVARVRGIRRCRFARSVPPHPPRTFGARLPLPTGARGRKRSERVARTDLLIRPREVKRSGGGL